jgi:hypothetical protein
MTKEQRTIIRLYDALKEITQYQSPERLRRDSLKDWGVPYPAALEGAYENILYTAKMAIKGVRLPKDKDTHAS